MTDNKYYVYYHLDEFGDVALDLDIAHRRLFGRTDSPLRAEQAQEAEYQALRDTGRWMAWFCSTFVKLLPGPAQPTFVNECTTNRKRAQTKINLTRPLSAAIALLPKKLSPTKGGTVNPRDRRTQGGSAVVTVPSF